jgi:hypothetical protein
VSDPAEGEARKRKGSREKNGRNFLHALTGCLFPRRQGVTGMNPTALPASLTGRIWFFLSNYGPQLLHLGLLKRPTCVPLTPFELTADSFGVLCGVRAPGDPSPTYVRLKRLRGDSGLQQAPTEVPIRARAGPCLSSPFPWRDFPAACKPNGLLPRIRTVPTAWLVPSLQRPEPSLVGCGPNRLASRGLQRAAGARAGAASAGPRLDCHRSRKQPPASEIGPMWLRRNAKEGVFRWCYGVTGARPGVGP